MPSQERSRRWWQIWRLPKEPSASPPDAESLPPLDAEGEKILRSVRAAQERQRAGKPAMELKCGGCGKNYRVGTDSVLVTADDVAEMFDKAIILKSASDNSEAFSQEPDLVSAADPEDRALMLRARYRGETIRATLMVKTRFFRVPGRWWRCHNCDFINQYQLSDINDFGFPVD